MSLDMVTSGAIVNGRDSNCQSPNFRSVCKERLLSVEKWAFPGLFFLFIFAFSTNQQ